jgi:hypothetical protein
MGIALRRPRLNSERDHRVTSWRPGRPEYNSPWWVNHGRLPAVLWPLVQPSEARSPFLGYSPLTAAMRPHSHNQS